MTIKTMFIGCSLSCSMNAKSFDVVSLLHNFNTTTYNDQLLTQYKSELIPAVLDILTPK